jgi:GTPase SAR1 family protein
MKLLSYAFQAFFQPKELEDYLGRKPSVRKRVAWAHVALTFIWFGACFSILYFRYESFGFRQDTRLIMSLAITLSTYALTMIIGLASGGLSKRDSLLTFVVSTYWSFIVSLISLSIPFLINSFAPSSEDEYPRSRRAQEFIASLILPLCMIVISAIVVNLNGKTRGIRHAFYIMVVSAALAIFLLLGNPTFTSRIVSYQNPETGRKIIVLELTESKFQFIGIIPFAGRSYSSKLTVLEIGSEPERQVIKSKWIKNYDEVRATFFTLTENIFKHELSLSIDSGFPIPTRILNKVRPLVGKTYRNAEEINNALTTILETNSYNQEIMPLFSKIEGVSIEGLNFIEGAPFQHIPRTAFRIESRDGRLIDPIGFDLPNSELLVIQKSPNGTEFSRKRPDGTVIWRKILDSKVSAVDIEFWNNFIYLDTENIPRFLKLDTTNPDGEEIPVNDSFDWYPSRFGSSSNPINAGDAIYRVSPSGYLFATRISDGKANVYREPINADRIRNFLTTTIPLLFILYIISGTLILCIGLYRIPLFLVESFLQLFVLLKIRVKPSSLRQNIRSAPLLFDHILSLPLPFSRAFLSHVAKTDERQGADLLIYLLEKTQQTKLAAGAYKSFFRDHPNLTFEYLYRLLKPEKRHVLEILLKNMKLVGPVSELLRSYHRLLSADRKEPHIAEHTAILKEFAETDYRYAREAFLTYEIFEKFYGFRNVQELADADTALTELQAISIRETLNVNLIGTFNLIAELANDLKNYDVVESFRDKQYYLSEARIKLYEVTRRAQKELSDPEAAVLLEIAEKWQELIITEAKVLRGPAELELVVVNKSLTRDSEWNNILVTVTNAGQSPAENISVSLLENENLTVLEDRKNIRLLGTSEVANIEFTILSKGNPSELRMYFDTTFDDFERKNKVRTFADVIRLSTNIEEFKRIPNPYVVGTPVQNEKLFFGRKKVFDFAVDNLSAGEQNNVLIFFGQRRIGKSSLLYRLKNSTLKADYLFVYIDCQGFADSDTGKTLYRICESIHAAASENNIYLEAPNLERFKDNTFIELDAYLDRAEKALELKTLVLMLDEYEFLEYKVKDGSLTPAIFDKLRNIMQHRNKKMTFIFVGTHRLQELTSTYWSFLFNTALYYEIGSLGEPEARALITEPVKGYLRYDELAVDKILRVTGMHPYFIQGTCRAIVNYCNRRKKNYVTLTDVNEVMREAVESSTAHVKYLYQDYANETERTVLTLLARVTDDSKLFSTATEISRFASENQFEYDPKFVQEILSGLKNKRLIREDGEQRGELFGFEYEFLRIWIKEHIKIRNGSLFTS